MEADLIVSGCERARACMNVLDCLDGTDTQANTAGPLGEPVQASYGSSTKPGSEGLAVIEMASASGTAASPRSLVVRLLEQCLWCRFGESARKQAQSTAYYH